jgi:hypothetical protein
MPPCLFGHPNEIVQEWLGDHEQMNSSVCDMPKQQV